MTGIKIVVATLYEVVGGSSKVLIAAAEALRADNDVVLRAPLPIADSRSSRFLSTLSLNTWWRKILAIPGLLLLFIDEWAFIGKSRPDVVYVHDEPSLYIYGLICRARRIPVVWHVHMREGDGLRRFLRTALCDAKVFVSGALVKNPQRKPWRVIANPIVIGRVVRRPAGGRDLIVGMLGSISALKNQECGIRVIAELHQRGVPAQLLIFGNVLEASYRLKLESLISELGLSDCVDFRGFVLAEQALSEIDVLLACSTYESFGLAVGEALAAGVPVVASDVPAYREFAAGKATPMLAICASGVSEMAHAVIAARSDDDFSRQIRQTFGIERFSDAIAAFFREMPRL